MAEVRLADVIVPLENWAAGTLRESIRINALFNAGIVANDPLLTQFASENRAQMLDIPFLGDLADDEPNVSSDDPAVLSVPKKVTSEREMALKSMKNQSWSTMDLASVLGVVPDPARAIASRVAAYWNRQYDIHVIKMLNGLVLDNVANNAGDMVVDISGNAGADIISGTAVVDATQTMGDRNSQISAMVAHSTVVGNLRKQNLITTVTGQGPSGSDVTIDTYQGKRIVESDSAQDDGGNYYTYFFANGAIRWGNGAPKVPVEVQRVAASGNGEGQETLHSRNHFVFHPLGYKWEGAAVTGGQSPNWADLENPVNWTRVAERKRVPIAVLISKG